MTIIESFYHFIERLSIKKENVWDQIQGKHRLY
jgi:hypothetical protein